VSQLAFVDNANNVTSGSYMNDAKSLIDSMKDQDLMKNQTNYMVEQENRVDEFVKTETSLTDDLAYQTKALSEQFQQVRNQDQMNTVTQLLGMLDAGGSYGVDKLFGSEESDDVKGSTYKVPTGQYKASQVDSFKLYLKGGNYAV